MVPVLPFRALLLATLTGLTASAGLAQTTSHPASPVSGRTAARRPSLAIESYASASNERVIVLLGGAPAPELRTVPDGIELLVDDRWMFRLAHYHSLERVTSVEFRDEGGKSIALFRLACACDAKVGHERGVLTLDIREQPSTGAAAKSPIQPSPSPVDRPDAGLERLRNVLTTKLAQLNAAPPPAPSPPNAPSTSSTIATTPAAPGSCPPRLDLASWKGTGSFSDQLALRRARAAMAHEAAPEMAALAQLYLGYGLAAEALSVLQQAQPVQGSDADRTLYAELADVGHLLRHEPIAASSPLLAGPPACDRTDAPLWQALAATVGGDDKTVASVTKAAATVLSTVPEPLLQLIAFDIADGAPNDLTVLRAIASVVRNTRTESPESEAARFLIQSRIAGVEGDIADQLAFLERAAAYDGTVPGATAKVELAGLHAKQDGPVGAAAEVVLADAARVYRSDALGQTAAGYLAARRLRLGDYATALAVADESAGSVATRRTDSLGAAMAARILRQLLALPVNPDTPSLAERLTLYWRYEGYATPGPQGDDIRLAAARTMLAADMPAAALDLLNSIGASAQDLLLRAAAEARAGDPAAALVLLQALPASDDVHRIAADALARLGRPGDAAHELDGLTGLADRVRRTELLEAAAQWAALAPACDDLLRDAALVGPARQEVADRYGFALALGGQSPDPRVSQVPGSLAARLIAAVPAPATTDASSGDVKLSLTRARDAIARTKQVETLLPSIDAKQGS